MCFNANASWEATKNIQKKGSNKKGAPSSQNCRDMARIPEASWGRSISLVGSSPLLVSMPPTRVQVLVTGLEEPIEELGGPEIAIEELMVLVVRLVGEAKVPAVRPPGAHQCEAGPEEGVVRVAIRDEGPENHGKHVPKCELNPMSVHAGYTDRRCEAVVLLVDPPIQLLAVEQAVRPVEHCLDNGEVHHQIQELPLEIELVQTRSPIAPVAAMGIMPGLPTSKRQVEESVCERNCDDGQVAHADCESLHPLAEPERPGSLALRLHGYAGLLGQQQVHGEAGEAHDQIPRPHADEQLRQRLI